MNILILANHDVGLYQFRRELIAGLLKAHSVTISLPKGDLVRPLEEMGCTFLDTPWIAEESTRQQILRCSCGTGNYCAA